MNQIINGGILLTISALAGLCCNGVCFICVSAVAFFIGVVLIIDEYIYDLVKGPK